MGASSHPTVPSSSHSSGPELGRDGPTRGADLGRSASDLANLTRRKRLNPSDIPSLIPKRTLGLGIEFLPDRLL